MLGFPHIPCLHDDLTNTRHETQPHTQQGWRSDLVSIWRLDHTPWVPEGHPQYTGAWFAREAVDGPHHSTTSDRTKPLAKTQDDSNTGVGSDILQHHFRHVAADGKPKKKWTKGGAKGSVSTVKEFIQLGCVSQDYDPRKILRESGKFGSKHAVKFTKGTWNQNQILERKVPSPKQSP